jgi:glycosyltransferase involved in cell wall biosynthesis
VPVHVIYGSNFSIAGYRDKEFGASFAWDADLVKTVPYCFLQLSQEGGASCYEEVSGQFLSKTLTKLQPKAVLALGYSHPFDKAATSWAIRSKTPLLFRGEASDHAHARSWLKSKLRDFYLRRLYRKCSVLLPVGTFARQHYTRLGASEAKLIPSGYCVNSASFRTTEQDRSDSRFCTRQRLGIQDDCIVVLFSGKLSERKGVDLLPEALRALATQHKVHLLCLGDGALRDQLQAQCKQQPEVPLTITGFINQQQLSDYYHAADLLVLPSRSKETWGLVVNEALMHGLPCVVSDQVGSHPDLVIPQHTGSVCKSNDVADLTRSIAEGIVLLKNSGLRNACQKQVAAFTVEAAASGLRLAYQKALSA